MGEIRIENLRNISILRFNIPQQGVWLLSGANGSGKTSLLACLRRIGNPNAFPIHFPSSIESEHLDNFAGASVTYSINGEEVEYAYRGARWAPRPRSNSHLLDRFGYPQVIYLGANAERITPRPDDFVPRRVRAAPTQMITAANSIFETDKFSRLKVMNLTTGRSQAFLLETDENPRKYHSEKQFSLGELCVIKLIDGISECSNQSLILIDELEMALHPRAQIQLYRYLLQIAEEKRLTVIFSTHSVSLLKAVPRSKVIYLDREGGVVSAVKGCFPTYAIGNIALTEERAPDVVFYVEDEVAQAIVEPLIKLVLQNRFAADNLFPDVRVVPIGGFDSVVKFLTHHDVLLPSGTRAFALLDEDVQSEIIASWESSGRYDKLAEYNAVGARLAFLPWTPEVGITNFLRERRGDAERDIRAICGVRSFSLEARTFAELSGLSNKPLRNRAKVVLKHVATSLANATGKSVDQAYKILCQQFAVDQFAINRANIMSLFAGKLSG